MDNRTKLVDEACLGNPAAIAELFEIQRPRLKRMVALRMHPRLQARVDASDVVQETYIEVNRRLADYAREKRIPFFLWLRMLAIDRLDQLHRMHLKVDKRDAFREAGHAPVPTVDASIFNLANQLAGQFTSVDRNLLRDEVHVKLIAALESMDSEQREILVMRHYEELSTHEIAELLGLSRSGVLKRYTRAVRKLRAKIAADTDLQPE